MQAPGCSWRAKEGKSDDCNADAGGWEGGVFKHRNQGEEILNIKFQINFQQHIRKIPLPNDKMI